MSDALPLVVLLVGAGIAAPILAAIIQAGWQALMGVARWTLSWVVVRKEIPSREARDALIYHLAGKSLNAGVEQYVLADHYVKSLRERRHIWSVHLGATWRIFFYKGAPMLFSPSGNSHPGSTDDLMYLRGTVDFTALLRDVENRHAEHRKGKSVRRFAVVRHGAMGMETMARQLRGPESSNKATEAYPPPPGEPSLYSMVAPVGWEPADLGLDTEGAQIDQLSLSPDLLDVIRDVRFWNGHRDWYQERGIPWKRGYLLHGAPGTGKSSLVRAIAEDLDMPVHVFDLAGMSNGEFTRSWEATRNWSPRVVLIEDIDTVFRGRECINEDTGLTFDVLLNTIDGIEREDGLLLFVTTNHVEHVDPALGTPDGAGRSSRPGRIDRTVEVTGLDHAGRVKLAARILKDQAAAERMAAESAGDTAAQLQERAMQEARRQLWDVAAGAGAAREGHGG